MLSGKSHHYSTEQLELKTLRREKLLLERKIEIISKKKDPEIEVSSDESEDDEDTKEEQDRIVKNLLQRKSIISTKTNRSSVSAEVYGRYNKRDQYMPKIHYKEDKIRQNIFSKLSKSFLFSSLDETDMTPIINAMVEKEIR